MIGRTGEALVEHRRAMRSVALVGALIAAGCSGNQEGGTPQTLAPRPAATPSSTEAPRQGRGTPVPEYLRDILRKTADDKVRTDVLADMPFYRENASFQIGSHAVKVVQLGDELASGPLGQKDIDTIRSSLAAFDAFAQTGDTFQMPIKEVSAAGVLVSERTARLTVRPHAPGNEILVSAVPSRLIMGPHHGPSGDGTSFTMPGLPGITPSFVRPDYAPGKDAMSVEACQATVEVVVQNPEEFTHDRGDIGAVQVRHYGQEALCNALGTGFYSAREGIGHPLYLQQNNLIIMHSTNIPTGSTDLTASIPLIGNPAGYSTLKQGIPPLSSLDLIFDLTAPVGGK